jgi:hypothetical protein
LTRIRCAKIRAASLLISSKVFFNHDEHNNPQIDTYYFKDEIKIVLIRLGVNKKPDVY